MVIDEITAPIVQEIFALAAQGIYNNQIARQLTERGILTPRAYVAEMTGKYQNLNSHDCRREWDNSNVMNILKNQVYLGHIVSQKQTTKSFKSKKTVNRPESEWVIVRDTHEALIDEDTFELVRNFIRVRKRPNSKNEHNIFAGLTKCPDCGYGLAYNSMGKGDVAFVCNLYKQRSKVRSCTSHYISYKALYNTVLKKIRNLGSYVASQEKEFEDFYNQFFLKEMSATKTTNERKLETLQRRNSELYTIIKKLFEQNAQGSLSDTLLAAMTTDYENEQRELQKEIEQLETVLSRERDSLRDAEHFVKAIAKYKDVTELNASLLHELIEKICTHNAVGKGKARTQKVDIYWRFIGLLPEESQN